MKLGIVVLQNIGLKAFRLATHLVSRSAALGREEGSGSTHAVIGHVRLPEGLNPLGGETSREDHPRCIDVTLEF